MKYAPMRKWSAGLLGAAALVVGLSQVSSAAVAAPSASAAGSTTPTPASADAYPRVGQPDLYTSNIDTMSSFYQRLGFTELYRFTMNGVTAFATLENGPAYLTLTDYNVLRQSTGLKNIGPSAQKQSDVTILVDNVDATVAAMKSYGAKVLMAPKTQPWGDRQAFILDPEGNLVQISTHHLH
jgi:lactoylglutathione lyase